MLDQKLNRKKIHEASSPWVASFTLTGIKCLIVCRGPVRKEAIEVFKESGVAEYGILLSEKDSIVYPKALAPELRDFEFPDNVHRVPDYMGSGKDEKMERIKQIIDIAVSNGYTHIFAGYGFMAEDSEFIEAIEQSGVTFMGPSSHVAKEAGAKDEAKKLARSLGVSVTPGLDNVTALALVRKLNGSKDALSKLAKENSLEFSYDDKISIEENAENLLQKSYTKLIELVTIADLQKEAEIGTKEIWKDFPGKRIRFKYIGGGGGKGQRVIQTLEEVPSAVMEILAESKVVAPGSNRNFLIELNIENTRHNEIQLIGNGEWSLSLGGRDCSVQMHEQKLLELSLTQEQLKSEIEDYSKSNPKKAEILKQDLQCLSEMESQAEVFGKAVRLDSVSTFESIVEGTNHFFMEMNTRIQVEHRVTEMAYRLKFTNPNDVNDYFYLDSLIEAMAMLSVHGKKVPKPERVIRNISGAEVRINATNRSLQPHAGGIINSWSSVHSDETRDDQGIGTRNPDTGAFVHYHLAGAYDSNIALLITHGVSRKDNLERLANIIRCTELRGVNLETNLQVHYGLASWILGKDAMFKPSTQFMTSYLAGVGALESIIRDLDLNILWNEMTSKLDAAGKSILKKKETLILRPLERLLSNPHVLAGFLGLYDGRYWKIDSGSIQFLENPISILDKLYHYLHLEDRNNAPSSEKIWDHDEKFLSQARNFYAELDNRKLANSWLELDKLLGGSSAPKGIDSSLWNKITESHRGFQLGMYILKLIPNLSNKSGFNKIGVDDHLNEVVPEEFKTPKSRDAFIKVLSPPPKASSDEIIAPMGGMFYAREAPNLPPLVSDGDHFKAGQPLFIIEVMKMFNKISVPFSGKIEKNLMADADGKIISKGQTIFKIVPDELIKEESIEEITARRKKISLELVSDN
ncbi:ATP-binding protein [Leptospira sp. GIMC2001]|uniref:ATP-binding protein n=1 Tax=Leptospira sp. GIMC2001 TaxID=1513297 RepID=UPI00234AB2FB|nr:biotin/lipoyl-containing protein [Leptospira sp. GIMC2001]WCL47845.1 biotin carboxylase [Leptospira sp. GIMC2001]